MRQSAGKTVKEMKKAIGTMRTDDRHKMCPQTTDTWCAYQSDKINGTSKHKKKPGIPSAVVEAIKPIFLSLSGGKLLERCLHGKTQNSKKSLNSMIWKRCPKDVFVGKESVEVRK